MRCLYVEGLNGPARVILFSYYYIHVLEVLRTLLVLCTNTIGGGGKHLLVSYPISIAPVVDDCISKL